MKMRVVAISNRLEKVWIQLSKDGIEWNQYIMYFPHFVNYVKKEYPNYYKKCPYTESHDFCNWLYDYKYHNDISGDDTYIFNKED